LITKESSAISKRAQDEKIKELEKKIEDAKTPEELDAIEKELQTLEGSSGGEEDSASPKKDEKNDAKPEKKDEAKPPVADKKGKSKDEDKGEDAEEDTENADMSGIMKKLKDIEKNVDDKKTGLQEKLVNQLEQLNDQMGLNKIVDLNTTVDTGGAV